ncbi:glycosyltransferase family 39 protein [Candidatus Parcubacteria bacterium]|nr:glycosyltransferase family 39 protein [Patescibacteria group bacterium]MCG2689399.1 glycosyltransferase family 39 protein [Candidatus Parcubacteria bacterium]
MTILPKMIRGRKLLVCGLVLTLALRIIGTLVIPLDSDEVMWSVMVDEMSHLRKFYLFFATQNYSGALESYVILPFQAVFGITPLVLRINTIIWSILTSLLIYYIVCNFSSKKWGFIGILMYNLMSPENFLVHSKAWANYPFIEFSSLFSFYLLWKWIESKKEKYLLGLGLLVFVSFISNMQYTFALAIVLGFLFFYLLKELIKSRKVSFISLIMLAMSSFIYYLFVKKRMFFNPLETLRSKLRFSIDEDLIRGFDISVIAIIGVFFAIYFLWYAKYKIDERVRYLKAFLTISAFFFGAFAFYAYLDSFSRVSGGVFNLGSSFNYLTTAIFPAYLGRFWMLFALPVIFGIVVVLTKIVRNQKLALKDYSLVASFCFPIFFALSAVPGLSGSARYLISWWPNLVISTVFFVYYIWKKNRIFSLALFVSLSFWLFSQGDMLRKVIIGYAKERESQKKFDTLMVNKINASEAKYCVGDYWKVGPIMFDAKLKVKCWADKKETRADYLDFYKYRIDSTDKVYQVE